MPCLNELNLSFRAVQRAKDAVDAIARVTKNMSDIPSVQTLNEKIAYCLRHRDLQAYWHRSVECSQPDPTSEGSNRLVFRFRASEGLLRNKGPSKAVGDLTCRRKNRCRRKMISRASATRVVSTADRRACRRLSVAQIMVWFATGLVRNSRAISSVRSM